VTRPTQRHFGCSSTTAAIRDLSLAQGSISSVGEESRGRLPGTIRVDRRPVAPVGHCTSRLAVYSSAFQIANDQEVIMKHCSRPV